MDRTTREKIAELRAQLTDLQVELVCENANHLRVLAQIEKTEQDIHNAIARLSPGGWILRYEVAGGKLECAPVVSDPDMTMPHPPHCRYACTPGNGIWIWVTEPVAGGGVITFDRDRPKWFFGYMFGAYRTEPSEEQRSAFMDACRAMQQNFEKSKREHPYQ